VTNYIESLGKSQKRELESRPGVLLRHFLKRNYVQMPEDHRGWENTIKAQRRELDLLRCQSPSLENDFAEVFEQTWQYSLRRVKRDYPETASPEPFPFDANPDLLLQEK